MAQKSSHAAARVSEPPTPSQLKEFFSQVESGRINRDNLQDYLRPQKPKRHQQLALSFAKHLELWHELQVREELIAAHMLPFLPGAGTFTLKEPNWQFWQSALNEDMFFWSHRIEKPVYFADSIPEPCIPFVQEAYFQQARTEWLLKEHIMM